jgi:hypothetical protein
METCNKMKKGNPAGDTPDKSGLFISMLIMGDMLKIRHRGVVMPR